MTMNEIIDQIVYDLDIEADDGVDATIPYEKSVMRAFRELKANWKTPVELTVPFSKRLDLKSLGVVTKKVWSVIPAYPKVGLTLGNVETGNVFQLAAALNYSGLRNTYTSNIDPIITQLSLAQVSNTLSKDFQWTPDYNNQVVYCTCKAPIPPYCTIKYVPDYQDVSEIVSDEWINYLLRLSEAYLKLKLGRSRSKVTVNGSNVELDGDTLVSEANAEIEQIREELKPKKCRLVIVD